jgi:hypothetical protein
MRSKANPRNFVFLPLERKEIAKQAHWKSPELLVRIALRDDSLPESWGLPWQRDQKATLSQLLGRRLPETSSAVHRNFSLTPNQERRAICMSL